MAVLSNITKESARRRDYKWQLDRAMMNITGLEKAVATLRKDNEFMAAFIKYLIPKVWP